MPRRTATPAPGDYDLLTVDVWDTLLRRHCHPDSVKLHVCRYLWLNYSDLLRPEYRDPWALLRLRQQAEHDIGEIGHRKGLDDEYLHRDVIHRWLFLAGLPAETPDPSQREDLVTTLEKCELTQERYVSYADPCIADELARHRGNQRHFLSDFYMPADAIHGLLRHHGMANLVDAGTVSCEAGLNKRSGRLYQSLHDRLRIPPDRHIHIGDNPHADVDMARNLGIHAIHYQPESEHRKRRHREEMFNHRSEHLRSAIEELMARDGQDHELTAAYLFGRRCSLMLAGFILQIMEKALIDRVERLVFFTREGEFFLEIYRQLVQSDLLGFAPPPADILHVSRLATFAGSLRSFSTSELMRLWNQYSVQSLHAFLVSLALDPALFVAHASRHGLDLQSPIRYPWQDPKSVAFLEDAEVRTLIVAHLERHRHNLLAYLDSRGLVGKTASVGIVDIGWRGTIQDNLAYLLPHVHFSGYYLGLNRFLNPQPENTVKSSFGPDLNSEHDSAGLLECVAPIEMLCNSPQGSVTGYAWKDGHVQVHRLVDPDENAVFETSSRDFQAGVIEALPFWANFLRTHAYSSSEIRPVALQIWSAIIQRPPAFLAQAYFSLNHNEMFGVGGFSDKRRLPTLRNLLLSPWLPRHRALVRQFLTETGWLPGLLACDDIDPAFRRTLRWLLKGIELRRRLRTGWRLFRHGASS